MLSGLVSNLSKYEKELAILDIVKNAEKEKARLDVAVYGDVDGWIYGWIAKRGHTVSGAGKDLAIFVDYAIDGKRLEDARKRSRFVAVISPSEDMKGLLGILGKKIEKKLVLDEKKAEGGEIRDIFYGLWNVAFFGFRETHFSRFEFSATIWMAALVILLASTSYPMDDLLRHAKIYNYGYDYANLFAYSWNFSFNPYLLFDYFAGFLDKNFGEASLKIMQVLCFVAFSLAFFLHTKSWDDRFRALIFILTLGIVAGRIVLARPTVFEAFFFLIGLTLSGLPAILFGIFMGSFYYMFPIFLIPLVFWKREYLISLLASLLFWVNYAGMDYFYDIYFLISSITGGRELEISENMSIVLALASSLVLFLIYLFLKSKNFTYWPQAIFFLILNQIRFIEVLAPLLAVSLREKKIGIGRIKLGFLENVFLLFILIASMFSFFPYYELRDIEISNGKVLCASMQCMFNTVYTGRNITISPSMEMGLTNREVQREIRNIMNGTLNCSFFGKYDYDFLIESSLREIPECLSLVDVERDYRIWEVKKAENGRG